MEAALLTNKLLFEVTLLSVLFVDKAIPLRLPIPLPLLLPIITGKIEHIAMSEPLVFLGMELLGVMT